MKVSSYLRTLKVLPPFLGNYPCQARRARKETERRLPVSLNQPGYFAGVIVPYNPGFDKASYFATSGLHPRVSRESGSHIAQSILDSADHQLFLRSESDENSSLTLLTLVV